MKHAFQKISAFHFHYIRQEFSVRKVWREAISACQDFLRINFSTKEEKYLETGGSMIYDDVFRTIQERMPRLLIPLINEAFHTDYAKDELVERLPEEYQKVISKVVADSCSMVRNHIYHIECQSTKDGTMAVRMVEYDFMIGLSRAEMENGQYRIRFPRSCILYLRHNEETPEEEALDLEFADGQKVKYAVPVIKVQNYTLKELFDKKLYIYLPYYIMRYEKRLPEISRDKEAVENLLKEYEGMLEKLRKETCREETGVFQDLAGLIRKVADYQLRKEADLKERMGRVMGGKVLELPSDALREAEKRGEKRGKQEGLLRGEARVNRLILMLQEKSRMDDLIRAASDGEYQKKLFEEFGI